MSASVKINDLLSLVLHSDESVTLIARNDNKSSTIAVALDEKNLEKLRDALQAVIVAKSSKPCPPEFNASFGKNVEDLFS